MFGNPFEQFRAPPIPMLPPNMNEARLATKRLYIKGSSLTKSLTLKKNVLQTILKKQYRNQFTNRYLSSKPLLIGEKHIGYRFKEIYLHNSTLSGQTFGSHSAILNHRHCKKFLLSCKRAESFFDWSHYSSVPLPLKNVGALINLSFLSLSLEQDVFFQYPNFLKNLVNIKTLRLIFDSKLGIKYEEKQKASKVFPRFFNALKNSKKLEFLFLEIREQWLDSSYSGITEVLSCLNPLKHLNFDLRFYCQGQILDVERFAEFLQDVEFLTLDKSYLPADEPSTKYPRKLGFYQSYGYLSTAQQIISKCSSLKDLCLNYDILNNIFPESLENNKKLKSLKISMANHFFAQDIKFCFANLARVLSEISFESFEITVFKLESDFLDEMNELHLSLLKNKLKSYNIKVRNMFHEVDNACMEIFFKHLASIESLESFNISIQDLEYFKPFRYLLTSLKNLKNLRIQVDTRRSNDEFPFADFKYLTHLTDLEIAIPDIIQQKVLAEFPKLPDIQNLIIKCHQGENMCLIGMNEYNSSIMGKN